MPKVKLNNGEELDSTYAVKIVDGVPGLILESWGPKDRNPDYAKSMEQILSRLIENKVSFVNVYVVSRDLTRTFPNLEDRAVKINGAVNIDLSYLSPRDLRIQIGREVGNLKENQTSESKGGNRFKRLLMHSPFLDENNWHVIAASTAILDLYEPTAEPEKLERLVSALQHQELVIPKGSLQPNKSSITSVVYYRDPMVKAWVLKYAHDVCEVCSNDAPFRKLDGTAYLEVHHLRPLSEGGSDIVENCIAVCPNCHRRLHFGNDKESFLNEVRSKISRLAK